MSIREKKREYEKLDIRQVMKIEAQTALDGFSEKFFMGCDKPTVKYIPIIDQWCNKCISFREKMKTYFKKIDCKYCCKWRDTPFMWWYHLCIDCVNYYTTEEQKIKYCCYNKYEEIVDFRCNVGRYCKECITHNYLNKDSVKWIGKHCSDRSIQMTLEWRVQKRKAKLTRCHICRDKLPTFNKKRQKWSFIRVNSHAICSKHKHLDVKEITTFFSNPTIFMLKNPYNPDSILKELHGCLTTPICVPTDLLKLIILYLIS
jgi:hypothetical protein